MDRVKSLATRLPGMVRGNTTPVVLFAVLTMILIVVIIAFLVWKMNRSKLDSTQVLSSPRKLASATPFVFPSSKLPALAVGQEFTFSMWLYLSDFQPTTMQKLVLVRKNSSGSGVMAMNPIVMLNNATNKLHVCIKTNRKSTTTLSLADVLSNVGANQAYMVATIEYVPMQRWVHVAFSVQDNLLSVYMDNSMYTVQSLQDMFNSSAAIKQPLFGPCVGDAVVGNANNKLSSSAQGYVSNIVFWNYALTGSQMSSVYKMGPSSRVGGFVGSLYGSLGLPEYGLRSPIYKVGDDDDDK